MIRFIKMWLLLRIMHYQEESIIAEMPDFTDDYLLGRKLYTAQWKFVSTCTNYHLVFGFLPQLFRSSIRPRKKGDAVPPASRDRIRELDSIIAFAKEKGFLEEPDKEASKMEVSTKEPRAEEGPCVRVSPKGDQFITLLGGFEAFIKEFPQTWALIGLSIIPWLISNHQWIQMHLHI